ncbi:hypothetical protein APHMUC_1305 [Anaplasma phagocytophilum str. ApMUC09]|uniref:Uncharacterized protein n=1 Tax=Anaplasma phagocytophilum str. ApMUC09 TaxID=1359152 RepID=A0A0F3NAK2_ANAPH|nr:hypothetical protein APHMUC_1305 [Anaplasma phagocytophilum str. ApMUC09]
MNARSYRRIKLFLPKKKRTRKQETTLVRHYNTTVFHRCKKHDHWKRTKKRLPQGSSTTPNNRINNTCNSKAGPTPIGTCTTQSTEQRISTALQHPLNKEPALKPATLERSAFLKPLLRFLRCRSCRTALSLYETLFNEPRHPISRLRTHTQPIAKTLSIHLQKTRSAAFNHRVVKSDLLYALPIPLYPGISNYNPIERLLLRT